MNNSLLFLIKQEQPRIKLVAALGQAASCVRAPFASVVAIRLEKLMEDLRKSQSTGIVIMLSYKP